MVKNDNLQIESVSIQEYAKTLAYLKKQVQESQIKAMVAANKELIKLYWEIGKTIAEKQEEDGWGANVIEKLVKDLQNEFPGMAGYSRTNVFRMYAFYKAYSKVAQDVAPLDDIPVFRIPWGHNILIIRAIKDESVRLWYAQKTVENSWSRAALESAIIKDLYNREGKAITNFQYTLPAPHSMLAQQALKDPYIFEHLTLSDDHKEKDLEKGLIDNVQKTLLELGKGFSFVGRQHHFELDDQSYFIDLLFYHFKLKCFVVVELKAREFNPRDAGQINFYLTVVDEFLKAPDDKPTIGLILCKTKRNFTAEYALRNISSPIGVAEYTTDLFNKLPKELRSNLPTIEEIESELEKNELVANEEEPTTKTE